MLSVLLHQYLQYPKGDTQPEVSIEQAVEGWGGGWLATDGLLLIVHTVVGVVHRGVYRNEEELAALVTRSEQMTAELNAKRRTRTDE